MFVTNVVLYKAMLVSLHTYPLAKLSKPLYQVSYNTSYTIKLIILFIDHWNEITVPNIHDTTNTISDIWTADGIKQHDIFFSAKGNLGLSIFTDGVPLFKSSSMTFWPVYGVILNLPPSIRNNPANIMLLALWCGPMKPSMQLLH